MLTLGGAALDTEKNLLMVGDAAAATGAPIGEVAMWVGRAYNAIQSGRPWGEAAMRLQELGVIGGDARTALEELAKTGAEGPEVWAAFQKSLGKFGGAMELQANTWEGLISTIKDNVKMALGGAFKPLFDAFKTLLQRITEFTSGEGFTVWIAGIGAAIAVFVNWVSVQIPIAIAYFQNLSTWFTNNKPVIVGILAALGVALLAFGVTSAIAAATAIAPMLPVIAIIAAIGVAVGLLYAAWTSNWGGIQDKTAAVWAWLQPLLGQLQAWLQITIPIALAWLANVWQTVLLPAIQGAVDRVATR
jgi:hypothetical protein